MIKTFICPIHRRNTLQHKILQQRLKLFCIPGEYRLIDRNRDAVLIRPIQNFFFIDTGNRFIRNCNITHEIPIVLWINLCNF